MDIEIFEGNSEFSEFPWKSILIACDHVNMNHILYDATNIWSKPLFPQKQKKNFQNAPPVNQIWIAANVKLLCI